ncbi:MAG: methylglyoxal synthase [Anaerolineae bacterium]|nr:methylglyoxal synthase [Anaerolineae bacterium]
MERQTIAMIAHDGKKADMVAFAKDHKSILSKYHIVGTGTTGGILQEKVGLPVRRMFSGPLGGDVQIASLVVEKVVQAVFFFIDPLGKHPHDPDIQTLMRICNVHNVPLAINPATALCIITAMELANASLDSPAPLEDLRARLHHSLHLNTEV